MCHDTGARPPLPPISGGAGDLAGSVELTAADGNRLAAYSATSSTPGGAGMVVLPDVRGLHPFYVDLVDRFADAGIHATAFDYFGRTAGAALRDAGFDYTPHVRQCRPDTVAADAAAAVAHVRSAEGGSATSVFTVGFCFGGRNSFNLAAEGFRLAGVIGFYGFPAQLDEHDTSAPTLRAADYTCPVLGLFGGADQGIPSSAIAAFRTALDAAKVPNEITVYDGAPHSFFDRTFERFAAESADAWARMLAFVEANR